MDLHPALFVMFVPPLLRPAASFKEDVNAFMVRVPVRVGLRPSLTTLLDYLQASIQVFCDSQPRASMLRGFTVTRANFQKDGITLLQPTMVRYAESIFPVVCSVIDARKMVHEPPQPPSKQPDWSDTLVSTIVI